MSRNNGGKGQVPEAQTPDALAAFLDPLPDRRRFKAAAMLRSLPYSEYGLAQNEWHVFLLSNLTYGRRPSGLRYSWFA